MILIFHLSKHFFKIYKLFLRSATPENLLGSRLEDLWHLRRLRCLTGAIFVKMASVFFFFVHKGLAVISQGF